MYCVFQTQPCPTDPLASKNIRVVNVGHCQTDEAIISALAMHGWQKQPYYLSQAKTAEDAVMDSIQAGW
jgi:hypothetical protein